MKLPNTIRPQAVALVAEDEVLLRMEAADLLNDAGFSVQEAVNAEGALGYLERHPEVQLLFTDVQMPGACDGFALAREVAQRWPHIAIVVVRRSTAGTRRPAGQGSVLQQALQSQPDPWDRPGAARGMNRRLRRCIPGGRSCNRSAR